MTSPSPPSIAVVGTGPVGRALAAAYVAGGGRVAVVVSRRAERACATARRVGASRGSAEIADADSADVVLVAVPDRALPGLAATLRGPSLRGTVPLIHTSGALPGDVLATGSHPTASLHPLQSFPDLADDAELATRVAGTHFFHEGGGAEVCAAMVAVWRGTMHRLAVGSKALYHAGAAVLSNHTVALFDAALTLFEKAGVSREEAAAPLATLLQGTAANVAAVGVPAALTGPVSRGDVDTVRRHLDALVAAAPELLESYVAMARLTETVARRKGSLTTEQAALLDVLLRRERGPRKRQSGLTP